MMQAEKAAGKGSVLSRILKPPTTSPIGIDWGSRCVDAVQLRHARGGWRLAALASMPRTAAPSAIASEGEKDERQEEIRRLASLLYRHGFTGRQIVLAVPKDKLLSAILELPPKAPNTPLDQLARIEFARVQKCEPQSFEMAYWELPASARQTKLTGVMAVGCKHADSESTLCAFEKVGFDCPRLDTRAAALVRACNPLLQGGNATAAILDMGYSSASLLIVRQGVIVYDRLLVGAGLNNLKQMLFNRFGLTSEAIEFVFKEIGLAPAPENQGPSRERLMDAVKLISSHFEQIIKDVQVSLTYASHQYPDSPPDRLLLVGAGAAIAGAKEHLNKSLKVDVFIASPSVLLNCPPALSGATDPSFVTALGLALAGGAL
jgi:type IV pilus assembly protein PilM